MVNKTTEGTWELGFEWAKSQYTKAQWIEIQANGKKIGQFNGMHYDIPEAEMHANAKIAVMAPQMLEAIKDIQTISDSPSIHHDPELLKIWTICNNTLKLLENAT